MRDYKNRVAYSGKPSRRKKIKKASQKSGRKKTSKSFGVFKFYAVIILIFLFTALYVKYQIDHRTDSVFTKIYELTGAKMTKSVVSVKKNLYNKLDSETEKTKKAIRKLEESSAVSSQKPLPEGRTEQKESSSSHHFYLYVPKKSQSGIVFVKSPPFETDEVSYKNMMETLLAFKPSGRDIVDLINHDARLNDVWMENDVLMLDFNSGFEYNRYGYMGLSVQIQQILWTVFRYNDMLTRAGRKDFKDVKKIRAVAFLVDGKRKDKIGGEGVPLKLFYTRRDLKNRIERGERT